MAADWASAKESLEMGDVRRGRGSIRVNGKLIDDLTVLNGGGCRHSPSLPFPNPPQPSF